MPACMEFVFVDILKCLIIFLLELFSLASAQPIGNGPLFAGPWFGIQSIQFIVTDIFLIVKVVAGIAFLVIFFKCRLFQRKKLGRE